MEDTQEVNGSAHKRKPVWPWVVLSFLVCIWYATIVIEGDTSYAEIFGYVSALITVPLIVAGFIDILSRIFSKKPLTREVFLVIFIPIFVYVLNMSWQGTPMYWKQKAENGNNIAPFILGIMYDKGKGSTPKDNQQAVYWYKKSIAQGDNNAQRHLDLMYKRYPGLKEKYQPYVYSPDNCLFEVTFPEKPTTTQNHSQAFGEVEVAKLTISGSLLKSECFDTHSSAEETITDKVNDVKETLKVLAELHKLNNISIVNNSKKTSHAFLKMEGYKNIADITTMYNIHAHYKNSSLLLLTVKGDKNEFSTNSVIDFLSSVKVKEPSEQDIYDNIKKNLSTAGIDKNVLDKMLQSFNSYEKYIQPAKEGDTDAQYYLGRMYHKGKDVIKNDEMAFLWFERAAEQGHAPSQLNLGLMYDKGESTPVNYKQAYYWYKKAAEQGNPRAQHNLGSKYIFGLGVEKDYNKAKFWYEKARDNSDKYITKRAIENIEKYKLSEY